MPGKNPYYDPSKSHHTPDGFTNVEPQNRQEGDFKRWRKERKAQRLHRQRKATNISSASGGRQLILAERMIVYGF